MYLALGNNFVFFLEKVISMHVRILPVSYLLDTTYLSYPTTDIFSRAHA